MDEKEHDSTTEDVNVSSEKPEEATIDLRAIRQSRGLTLKDVSSSTRISPQNLKAIEEQRFELLPEPIYARAFIDMYARVLDVDGSKILSLYDTYLKNLEPDEDKYEVLKRLAAKRRHLEIWLWLIIVSGLMVLIGAFYLYQWSTGDRQASEVSPAGEVEIAGEPQQTLEGGVAGETAVDAGDDVAVEGNGESPETGKAPADTPVADSMEETNQKAEDTPPPVEAEQPVTAEEQPAVEEATPEAAPGPDAAVPATEQPYILAIEASELTWIEIIRDGGTPSEVMLWPGERITEKASEGFVLLIGNAGGVDIRFQGKPLGLLGKHGQVIRLTLPATE